MDSLCLRVVELGLLGKSTGQSGSVASTLLVRFPNLACSENHSSLVGVRMRLPVENCLSFLEHFLAFHPVFHVMSEESQTGSEATHLRSFLQSTFVVKMNCASVTCHL